MDKTSSGFFCKEDVLCCHSSGNSMKMIYLVLSKANGDAEASVAEQKESGSESRSDGGTGDRKASGIVSVKKGNPVVKLDDGSEVSLQDADLSPDDALIIKTVTDIDGISAEDAGDIFKILKAVDSDPAASSLGAMEAYRYGFYGFSEKHLADNANFAKKLTETQRKAIYEIGKKARDTSVAAETESIKQKRSAAEGTKKEPAKLHITYDQGRGRVHDLQTGSIKGLNRKQKAAVAIAKVLQKMGVGTDFEFFSSYLSKTKKDEEGNRVRVFLDANGNEVVAYSGVYRTGDGKIRIDLNAYSGRGLALNAMSHELVHFIKQWSPEKYRTMGELVSGAYEKTTMSMDQRVRREQNRLKGIRKTEVSYDEAYDEVVANALNRMLDDGTVVDRIAEIRKTDRGLADKMIECIHNFAKKLASIFANNESLFYDTYDLMQFKETVDELRNLFTEALVEASDNRLSSIEADAVKSLGENASVETNADGEMVLAKNESGNVLMYSEQTYQNGGREKLEAALQQDYAREQYSSQQTDRDRQQYNAFREKFAKDRLDSLSDKLGNLFPLSAGFEQAIKNDKTPVSNMTITANSINRGREGFYKAAKDAFKNLYGTRPTFSINQLGITAYADDNFMGESLSKEGHNREKQTLLDLIPAYKQLIEDSRLLAVERLIHNDTKAKKESLLCYRLYNAYIREETYIDSNGSVQTHLVPHIVVFSVIQNLVDAKAHMVTDIKDVAIRNGPNSSWLHAVHANGNISIGNIADVYDVVKNIDRKKGGLLYSPGEMAYKFGYTQKESGELYSTQETDNITARDLLSSTDVATVKNEVAKKKLTGYQKTLEVMTAEEQRLREVRAQIKELSFAKGTRDTKKLKDLKLEAAKISNHLSVYEGQLQRMEKELQSVVKRERAKVVKEAEKRDKAVLAKEWMAAEVKQSETLRDLRETRAALRQQESDTAVMEKEFIRITKEYEKLDAKRGKTISNLREKLKNEAEKHRADNKLWKSEFGRLMREYDAAGRNIDRLEQKIERQKAVAKERVESRGRTAVRHKIQNVVDELNRLLLTDSKKHRVPDSLKKAVAEALDLVNMDTIGADERAAKYEALIAKERAKANPDQDKIDAYTVSMENILHKGEKMGQKLNDLHINFT